MSVRVLSVFEIGGAQEKQGLGRVLERSLVHGEAVALLDRTGVDQPCCFTYLYGNHAVIRTPAGFVIAAAPCGGFVLRDTRSEAPQYWIPVAPRSVRKDACGRLLASESARLEDLYVSNEELRACYSATAQLELVVWRIPSGCPLRVAGQLERALWYMLGSHTVIGGRVDVYKHLVAGTVFENRLAWPNDWRVFSENDAHALHLLLGGLAQAIPDPLLSAMRRQILLAVLDRQDEDGGFHHGEWTQQMESHYRLHCSAMHLMMDALSECADHAVGSALTSAAAFLARQSVDLRIGKWLLHDELEHSVAQMKLGPFRWVSSDAFGKTESNMLVLNSHLDGLVALDRYRELTGDTQYDGLVRSGREATHALLAQRSAEPLYRVVMWLVEMTFLPASQAARLPLWKRALKRLTWQKLIPRLPDIKARFPRLVMPGGYIDRELTLRTWAHDYHAINLMDLARYLRRFDDPVLREVLVQGLAFTRRSGILQRWRELDYQKYALGFWAEALYHVCTLFPDAQYREWLAEAMLVLEEMQMGQPPSLLGANPEAVPVAEQLPCPSPTDARLRIANLGRRGAPELLVVNAGDVALLLDWELAPAFTVEFHTGASNVPAAQPLHVPARGWLWGRAAK